MRFTGSLTKKSTWFENFFVLFVLTSIAQFYIYPSSFLFLSFFLLTSIPLIYVTYWTYPGEEGSQLQIPYNINIDSYDSELEVAFESLINESSVGRPLVELEALSSKLPSNKTKVKECGETALR